MWHPANDRPNERNIYGLHLTLRCVTMRKICALWGLVIAWSNEVLSAPRFQIFGEEK